jgi:phosphoglycerate dehydrogenase-like enzyme
MEYNVLIYFNWPVKFWNIPKSHVELLRERFPGIAFTHAQSEEEAVAAAADADILLTARCPASVVNHAGRLRWVQSSASAVSSLPLSDLSSRNVVVTNTRTVQGGPIAEHVMGGILVLSRRYDRALAAQRERRWIQNELMEDACPWSLRDKTITILGLGSIGREVARRARAFDMKVTGIRRRASEPKPPFVDRVLGPDGLDDGLRGCDVLVIAAPFLASTDRLIGTDQLALLHSGAILVNVARGKIVDQAAMIAALQSGQLGGAVLDVFDHEPLDSSSPLWTLPNVVITPHTASLRPDHWDDVIDLFSENLRRFARGEGLLNTVDPNAGY